MENQKIRNFTDLVAWKKGHELVLLVYKATNSFPHKETFALSDQMRRAAVSVTSNIAEGFSRRGIKEKIQFYYIALGSLTELHNQLIVASDLKYLDDVLFKEFIGKITDTGKLINGLIRSIKESD